MKTKLLLAVLLCAAMVGTVSAAPAIIDFSTGSAADAGTLTYAGTGVAGDAPLIGANIGIGLVRGVNTPSNNGQSDPIIGGLLNFTTGKFVSYNAGLDEYFFGGGGSITITGTGPGCLTIGGCGAPLNPPNNQPNTTSGPTLLTGSVVSATYQNGVTDLNIDIGTDTKDPALLAYFGFPADTQFAFSGSIHASIATGGGGGGFVADSTASTDIRNQAMPEPASVMFLGTVLIGLSGVVRRRFSKR